MKLNCIWVVLFFAAGHLHANDAWVNDTIYIQLDETLGKYVIHKVEKKQTLFSLANAYGLDLYDVYDYNPILKSRILLAGDQLKMPVSNDHIIIDESKLESNKKYRPVYYFVKAKESLYRISTVYFNTSFDEIAKRNKLTASSTIKINQKIFVGWFDPSNKIEGTPDFKPNIVKTEQTKLEQKWTEANPISFTEEYKALDLTSSEFARKYGRKENSSEKLINLNPDIPEIELKDRKEEKAPDAVKLADKANTAIAKSGTSIVNPNIKTETKGRVLKRRMVTQNGVAQWIKTENPSSDLYVLHPSAPINSVVEITNPMTHRKIYAKVLSHMPPKLYSDDINVVVSPGVANLLGVIDSRFYVRLRFVEETIQ